MLKGGIQLITDEELRVVSYCFSVKENKRNVARNGLNEVLGDGIEEIFVAYLLREIHRHKVRLLIS